MGETILHHNGRYLLYSTNSDTVVTPSMTEDELRVVLIEDALDRIKSDMDLRFKRAKERGTSAFRDRDLGDTIAGNLMGPDDTELPIDDFLKLFDPVLDGQPNSP